jgi:hypothetical protein
MHGGGGEQVKDGETKTLRFTQEYDTARADALEQVALPQPCPASPPSPSHYPHITASPSSPAPHYPSPCPLARESRSQHLTQEGTRHGCRGACSN